MRRRLNDRTVEVVAQKREEMELEPDGKLEVRSALRWSRSERPWPRSRGSCPYLRLSSCHVEQERPKVTVVHGWPLAPRARCDEHMYQVAGSRLERSTADSPLAHSMAICLARIPKSPPATSSTAITAGQEGRVMVLVKCSEQ